MENDILPNADEKFFFHMNNFDDEVIDEEPIEEEEEVLPPPPPLFTEAQLEAAKSKAFKDGHAQGMKEVEESRAQGLANLMQRLGHDVKSLFDAETAREETYQREVVALCYALFKQAYPITHATCGFDELTAQLAKILETQSGQRSIEIRVSGNYAAGVDGFMQKLKTQNSALSFTVTSDENLPDGRLQLSWADGGAIYDAPKTAQAILSNLEEILAGEATTSHDGSREESQIESEVSGAALPDQTAQNDKTEPPHADNNPIAEENNE